MYTFAHLCETFHRSRIARSQAKDGVPVTGILKRYCTVGLVLAHCNKASTTTKRVIIILLVECLAFHLLEKEGGIICEAQ